MDRLCGELPSSSQSPFSLTEIVDEIVQLIFYELTDPSPLTQVSRRFHRFSQDPYVRAHYFLAHYGPLEAIYHALGRGRVMTERVFDVRRCILSVYLSHSLLVLSLRFFSPAEPSFHDISYKLLFIITSTLSPISSNHHGFEQCLCEYSLTSYKKQKKFTERFHMGR